MWKGTRHKRAAALRLIRARGPAKKIACELSRPHGDQHALIELSKTWRLSLTALPAALLPRLWPVPL